MTEQKQHSNILYIIFLVLGIGGAASIFGIFFDSFSEDDMVNFSYPLAFLIIGGIAGLSTKNKEKALKNALVWGLTAMVLVFIFMVQIFPSL